MMLKGVRHVLGRHLARRRGGPGGAPALKNTLIQCTWAAARKNFDRRPKTVQTGRLITHLHKLGYAVRITL